MNEYEFGLLKTLRNPVEFEQGRVESLCTEEDWEELEEYLAEHGYRKSKNHDQVWLYPPQEERHTRDAIADTEFTPAPQGKRPAFLRRPLATHRLLLSPDFDDSDRLNASIIIQTLGFFFKARPQFSDWFIDKRVPTTSKNWARLRINGGDVKIILNAVTRRCRKLSTDQRLALRNILKLHNRVPAYHWEWEQFNWQYSVVDGAYRFMRPPTNDDAWDGTGQLRNATSHSDRLERMLEDLNIDTIDRDNQELSRAVELRNDLVHEYRWDGKTPGHGGSQESFLNNRALRSFSMRILLHALDIDCGFRHTAGFSTIGAQAFDLEGNTGPTEKDFGRN